MGSWLRILTLLGGLANLAGCVSFDNGPEDTAQVIERNKERPPPWTALSPGVLHESDNMLRFVEMQNEFLDLAIGIKQAQIGALAHSEEALRQRLRGEITELAKVHQMPLMKTDELDVHLGRSSKLFHSKYAKIKDVYYEKLANLATKQHYFIAHILVQLPRSKMNELLHDMSLRLTGSKDKKLRKLGDLVSRVAVDKGVTH